MYTHKHTNTRTRIHQIVAVPEAKVLHPYWSNPLKQVRGWAEGDVLCLEALPHLTFYALPNWAERICMVNAYAVIRSVHFVVQMLSDGPPTHLRACGEILPLWLWAGKVSLVHVLVEVVMRMAVHYPNAVRRTGMPPGSSAPRGCSTTATEGESSLVEGSETAVKAGCDHLGEGDGVATRAGHLGEGDGVATRARHLGEGDGVATRARHLGEGDGVATRAGRSMGIGKEGLVRKDAGARADLGTGNDFRSMNHENVSGLVGHENDLGHVASMPTASHHGASVAYTVWTVWTAARLHAYLFTVSLLAALPEACQDATRLISKLRRLKLNQICMCLDWMDGQHEHVTAVRVERFIKNVTCIAVLAVFDSRLPQALRGVFALTLFPVALLWVLQNNNRAVVGGRPRRCNLLAEPLPLNVHMPCHGHSDDGHDQQQQQKQQPACTLNQQSVRSLGAAWRQQWLARAYAHKSPTDPASCKTLTAATRLDVVPIHRAIPIGLPWSLPWSLRCRPFVVLTHQRAGSNLLCGFLHHHAEIAMHNELFHNQKIHTYGWKNHMWTPKQRDDTPVAFLTDVLSGSGCYKKSGRLPKAVGFKLLSEHWHRSEAAHKAFERLVLDPRVLKVVLQRENRLHTCVSAMRVGIKGVYITEQYDDIRVCIRPDEFQSFCDNYEAYFEYCDRLLQGQTFLKVLYEDLAHPNTQKECVRSVLEFLGVDAEADLEMNPACVRQSNGCMKSAIDNYDELECAFRHTKYAKDFE
jgi:LPS sulfotransferase NodH